MAGAGAIGIRAGNQDNQLRSVALTFSFIHADKLPEHDGVRRRRGALYRGSGKLDADANTDAGCVANADTNAQSDPKPHPDRCGFQREFDQ